MDALSHLVRAASGGRARAGAAPSPERLRELARQVAERRYRVPVEEIANALLRGPGGRQG